MRFLVAIGIVLLVLGGALWWLAEFPRGTREQGRAAQTQSEASSPAELGASPQTESPSAPPDRPEARAGSAREPVSPHSSAPARVRWFEGRVVLPAGTPVDEEAYVVERTERTRGSAARARVAPNGRFRMTVPEPVRGGQLGLEAKYLYLEQARPWRRDDVEPVVLEPKLGARIVGTLVLPPGETSPIGGKLELRGATQGRPRYPVRTQDVTDRTGFSLDALSTVGAFALHYVGERLRGERGGLVLVPGQTCVVDLVLRPGVTLAGVVRSELGEPQEGVGLRAWSIPAPGGQGPYRWIETTSAADGSFHLGALEGGRVELEAEHPGFLRLQRELGELAEGTAVTDLALVLDDGLAIAGVVRWPDGTPATVELELVRCEAVAGSAQDEIGAVSGADGAFAFGGLVTGDYRLNAWAVHVETLPVVSSSTRIARAQPSYMGWIAEVERVPAGTRDLVLTLSGGLALEGMVVDELGRPLESFTLAAIAIGAPTRRAELSRSFAQAAGAFRMEGFAPGNWKLEVRERGHATTRFRVALPAAEPVRLVVPREAVVRGIVLDPRGAPVPRARVLLRLPDRTFPDPETELAADLAGRFELEALGPGPATLHARGHRFAPSEPVTLELRAGERVEDLRLELREGGWTLFRVRRGGAPVDVPLWITDSDGTRHPASELGVGDYRFGPAAAGTYTVRARHDGQTLEHEFEVVPGAPEPVLELVFE